MVPMVVNIKYKVKKPSMKPNSVVAVIINVSFKFIPLTATAKA